MPVLTLTAPADYRLAPDDFPATSVRTFVLPSGPGCASAARCLVRGYCEWRGISGAVRDDLVLCSSEIAGNGRHVIFPPGRSHMFLRLLQNGPFVSVAVFDPDCRPECMAAISAGLLGAVADLGAESGRGLSSIVARLAFRRGCGLGAHQLKQVSFTIDALPSKSA